VPASEARAGTGTTAAATEEPVSASLANTFNEEELRGARPNVFRPVLVRLGCHDRRASSRRLLRLTAGRH
jgi:hypothetical protein